MKELAIHPGSKVDLDQWDTGNKLGLEKDGAKGLLEKHRKKLEELQYRLYAERKQALLIVLQGMDTSGKDGVIRHIFSGVNPQGCHVVSFKKPSDEELSHDFLWRIHAHVPAKGMITIFNRSHYEDVLAAFVHNLVPAEKRATRYRQINDFEKYLSENGVKILKFFLHLGRKEQGLRLAERLKDASKRWKFNAADEKERKLWKDYAKAYEKALAQCSAPRAPWYVIPSDHKWVRNAAVSHILTRTLEEMNPRI